MKKTKRVTLRQVAAMTLPDRKFLKSLTKHRKHPEKALEEKGVTMSKTDLALLTKILATRYTMDGASTLKLINVMSAQIHPVWPPPWKPVDLRKHTDLSEFIQRWR